VGGRAFVFSVNDLRNGEAGCNRFPDPPLYCSASERDEVSALGVHSFRTNLPTAMKTVRSNLKRDASNFDDYLMLVATIALFATLVGL